MYICSIIRFLFPTGEQDTSVQVVQLRRRARAGFAGNEQGGGRGIGGQVGVEADGRRGDALQGHEGEDEPPAGKDRLKGVGVGPPDVVGVPQGLKPCAPAAQRVHHLDRDGVVEIAVRPAAEGPDDARAYLRPALRRPNLSLTTGTLVEKVLIDGSVAAGIVVRDSSGRHTNTCEKEVIVCAGACNSPKVLMLSGIGDADQLRRHGLDVVAHVREVGRNLQNHPASTSSSRRGTKTR